MALLFPHLILSQCYVLRACHFLIFASCSRSLWLLVCLLLAALLSSAHGFSAASAPVWFLFPSEWCFSCCSSSQHSSWEAAIGVFGRWRACVVGRLDKVLLLGNVTSTRMLAPRHYLCRPTLDDPTAAC